MSHTIFHIQLFCVAGVALGDVCLPFMRRFCVAGVALGDICLPFMWQAWHLATRAFVLWGSWHLWHWAGSGGALGLVLVAGDAAALCVAGVALGDMCLRFAWQAWHLLWHWAGSGGALGPEWSPVTPRRFAWQAWHLATYAFVLRGRRGTWRRIPSFCVAGVALMALGWLWWRAWTGLVAGDAAALCVAGVALICTYGIGLAPVARLDRIGRRWRRGTLRRRRGTYMHLWHWAPVAGLDRIGRRWRRGALRGKRGTWRHVPSFCGAGVALMALGWLWWRAWAGFSRRWRRGTLRGRRGDLVTSTFVSRGNRGTWSHPPSFCVAAVALMALGWLWCHSRLVHTPSLSHTIFTHHLSHTSLSHTIFVRHHLSHTTLSHTICHTQLCHTHLCPTPSLTHNFVTHHLSHTTLSHPTFTHHFVTPSFTQLCHTPSLTHDFVTHHLSHTHTIFDTRLCHTPSFTHTIFVTPHLSHTTLSHTIFHTQLCHTPSFTHNFVTHHLSHTALSHTIFHTQLCHTPSFTHHLSHTSLSHTIFVTRCLSHTTFTHCGVMVSGNCEGCHRRRLMSWVTCHRKQVENVTFEAVTSGKSKFQTVEKYLNSLTRTACSTV